MNAARLKLSRFLSGDPLTSLGPSRQRDYLIEYLADLEAVTVLKEEHYFDRDYLEEFSSFYGTSSRGYPNICCRLHFFDRVVERKAIEAAAGGDTQSRDALQQAYLGFIVVRPIPSAPFGRTVLRWYDDPTPATPRVVEPSRPYVCHVAGIDLNVRGLAWQQQDSGVGACATIALWSMLHSIAFDDYHAIPTTSDITRFAHRTASLGQRVFPSRGLNIHQMCEAIKESGLAPVICDGDIALPHGRTGFSRARFSSYCASLIRSGYPLLIGGELDGTEGHAICCVGFRDTSPPVPRANRTELQDQNIRYLYVHDDNLGPNVRFEVLDGQNSSKPVRLKPSAPPVRPSRKKRISDPTAKYPFFRPDCIVAAVHDGLRTTPDEIHAAALRVGHFLKYEINANRRAARRFGITVSAKFRKLADYVGKELGTSLQGRPATLARARLALWEKVPPMSLHIGVARIGWGPIPLLDVLYDTTDTEHNMRAFCHVVFDQTMAALALSTGLDLGVSIAAF